MKFSLLSTSILLTACNPVPMDKAEKAPNVLIKDINSGLVSDHLYLPAIATAADRSH